MNTVEELPAVTDQTARQRKVAVIVGFIALLIAAGEVGYVVYLLDWESEADESLGLGYLIALIVGAPVILGAVSALIGLVISRRSPAKAQVFAFVGLALALSPLAFVL